MYPLYDLYLFSIVNNYILLTTIGHRSQNNRLPKAG